MPKTQIYGRMSACISALALAGAGLTACGGSSGATATNTNTGAHTTAAAAPTLTRTTTSTATAKTPAPANSRSKLAPHSRGAIASAQSTFRNALVSFASCLRQNGVNVRAPNTSSKGPVLGGLDTSSPQYRAALPKCRSTLVAAFREAAARARAARPQTQLRTSAPAKK